MKLTEATLNNLMVKRPHPSTEKPQGLCLDSKRLGKTVLNLK
jgi:hypothetical protein